ncbi:MAG: EpsI family protein [Nitrospirae bacterium]|nr:EpsI family protein [Nitrospirota bacterium]
MQITDKKKYFVVLALFALAAVFTFFYKVERHIQPNQIDLNAIPTKIGYWKMISEENNKNDFLNNILFRVYERTDGKKIMLAIAYGGDQRQNFSIHAPEGCYRAAGFDVTLFGTGRLDDIKLELNRLLVKSGTQSTETVQYWIVLNGKVVTNHFERKLKQIYYSFFGADAGGMLVRVSSFSNERDFQKDYDVQREFITVLHESLNPALKKMLGGNN